MIWWQKLIILCVYLNTWCTNFFISSHLSTLTLKRVGAPQMTLQQYLSTLPCLPLPSGNLQTPFPSIPGYYLPLLLFLFTVPLQICLRPAKESWDWPHHLSFCFSTMVRRSSCTPTALWILLRTSSFVTWSLRKCSEISYNISYQGLGFLSRFLLSRSSSHRHKGWSIRWASASA